MFNNQNGNTQQQTPTNQTPSSNTHTTTETPNNPPTTQAPTTTQQPTTQAPATTQTSSGHWERKWIVDSPAWDDEWDEYGNQQIVVCNTCGANITGNVGQHFEDTRDGNGNLTCWGYHSETIQVLIQHHIDHYPEQGHWEEVWIED